MLEITPSSIIFDDIDVEKLYSMTISLRNTTSSAQRIRLRPPKSNVFALKYIPTTAIAPGLEIRAEIECRIHSHEHDDMQYLDFIVASIGDTKFDISIVATRKHAILDYPSVLNLGYVPSGIHQYSKSVTITNKSKIKTAITFLLPASSIFQINPEEFILGELESKDVIVLCTKTPVFGIHRELFTLQSSSSLQKISYIDVILNVTDNRLFIMAYTNHFIKEYSPTDIDLSQGILAEIDCGKVFIGSNKKIKFAVVNFSPFPLSGKFDFNQNLHEEFSISPTEVSVRGFSFEVCSCTFSPRDPTPTTGFKHLYEAQRNDSISLRCPVNFHDINSDIQSMLLITGTALNPIVDIDYKNLNFGVCPVNDMLFTRITITNHSSFPINFSFRHHVTFKFHAPFGEDFVLHSQETMVVSVSFSPKNLGVFQDQIDFEIPSSSFKIPILLKGIAQGINKFSESLRSKSQTKGLSKTSLLKLIETFDESKFIDQRDTSHENFQQ